MPMKKNYIQPDLLDEDIEDPIDLYNEDRDEDEEYVRSTESLDDRDTWDGDEFIFSENEDEFFSLDEEE